MQATVDIRELQERIERESSFVDALTMGMNHVIVGQKHLVESLLIGLLADGHILLEGVPGLAKTLAIKTLAQLVKADFSRIQFTPDLLPADVVGTQIYSQKTEEFKIKQGPIFANFVLADEINRAPAKVQSALLEAMQERQITIGEQTYKLGEPFLVLATQNPIEQEGTYPLPEESVIARANPKVPVLHEAHRIHIHQHKRQVIGIKIITQLQVGAFAFVENHHALVGPDEELFIIKLLDTSDGQAVGAVKIHINRGEVGILFHHKVYSEGGGNPEPTAIV